MFSPSQEEHCAPNKEPVKYGELMVLGYNGCLPTGDRGRRKSRFALYKRPKANGVKPSTVHVISTPQASKLTECPLDFTLKEEGGSCRPVAEMNESVPLNETGAPVPWIQSSRGNSSLEFSSKLPVFILNPWDIMLCISGTIIACENAIVVAIIFYTPNLRTPMFVLIGSLATADLLAGVGLILNFVFQYVIQSETISLITVGFLVASFTASVSSLLAITVDRYLSLYNALTYYSEKTVFCIHMMLIITWGVSLCLGLLPVLGWNCMEDYSSCSIVRPLTKSNVTLLSASFFFIFILMLHLYIKICKIVCRHAHQIALQQHFLTASQYVATKKGVSTLAIILGTFGASWLPFAIYCVIGDSNYPAVYTYATLLPATYNSMINPIIYAYRNQEIQRSMWVLFCGCFQSKVSFRSRSPSDV